MVAPACIWSIPLGKNPYAHRRDSLPKQPAFHHPEGRHRAAWAVQYEFPLIPIGKYHRCSTGLLLLPSKGEGASLGPSIHKQAERMKESIPTVEASQQQVRVVVVDDHEVCRAGVRRMLGDDSMIEVIGEAETCDEAVSLITELQPDVVLLDIRLRVGTGMDVARAMKSTAPTTRILVLSAYDNIQYVSSLAKLGVVGYLLKSTSARDLRAAIRDVSVGKLAFAPEITPGIMRLIESGGNEEFHEAKRIGNLTERESQVMQHLSRGCGNSEIAGAIGIGLKTVEVHVGNIFKKLGVANRTQAALRARWGD